jgi:hypothetical protein
MFGNAGLVVVWLGPKSVDDRDPFDLIKQPERWTAFRGRWSRLFSTKPSATTQSTVDLLTEMRDAFVETIRVFLRWAPVQRFLDPKGQ